MPIRGILLALSGAAFLWVGLGIWTSISLFETVGWPAALLLIFITLTAMEFHARDLPIQNVFLAGAVIGVVSILTHALNLFTGIPFGPVFYNGASGPKLVGAVPWCVPLMAIAGLLLSRSVARLALRPWRKTRKYGLRVIGLTVVLTMILDSGVEVFVSQVMHLWTWHPTRLPFTWNGVPLFRIISAALMTLLTLAFITPALIRKQPGESRSGLQPLLTWSALNLLFASGAVLHGLWMAATLTLVGTVVTTLFTLRGARW
jgi:uncharacterized membrane protein